MYNRKYNFCPITGTLQMISVPSIEAPFRVYVAVILDSAKILTVSLSFHLIITIVLMNR